MSDLFVRLQAPLSNVRWSWGAVREADNALFLRVWDDQRWLEDGKVYLRLTDFGYYNEHSGDRGWNERWKQVQSILSHSRKDGAGNPAANYMIICEAVDRNATPRAIKQWNDSNVLVGGELIEREGDYWLERTGMLPIDQAREPGH
ncbi:hypothetical protein [Noviherbaspirillum pedocola]|uniref:Uncharacterized protein n=1 Tax=Noviherbaspirillum pedocola TaxID=2801341 RepID=A0A934SSX7_9BURK|nr:hypothetical protein [Noviherbaspirillum pedocola]MBK4736186.1 hypothetical protein [Noviherbaspirillum pedocola]